ncbi:ATP synthase F1 subunit gamma [Brachymonas denitrificans]|jgi:F-type H+-transporting ATPase subunit gamma|uniref:ATP synthase F1 subunit gamma n=1 Tax=Brachymonas denitrificans TaxID=28220 RepID=UPI001BD0454B|nr:ATP synthase F1 subunit gamma [Brachymonas denitrificans]
MQLTNTRDIRAQIANISKTRKITSAMQQISFAKLAQARKRAEAIRPYGRILRGMMARLVRVDQDYQPALMARRVPAHRIGVIVVTTDKGLCGPLNTRLLQQVVAQLSSWEQARRDVSLTVVGLRGFSTLSRAGFKVVAHVPCGCEFQHSEELLGTMSVPIMQFLKGEIDELYVATNRFVNTLNYEPVVSRFLPLDDQLVGVPEYLQPAIGHASYAPVDYVYEPGEPEAVDALLRRYVETIIYQAVAENAACEQAARMTAMKSATENADRRVEELTLQYHKARQEAITRELIEIVAGAAAIDGR